MTISLLLVVMRILTVTTRYKLEIFPVSGAPAAQQAWGWHRLGLPAFLPAPSHEPVWNTQALLELEVPPDLTLLPGSRQSGRTEHFSLPSSSRSPGSSPIQRWWGEPRGRGWRVQTVLEGGEVRAAPAQIMPWNKLPVQKKLPYCSCELPAVSMETNL